MSNVEFYCAPTYRLRSVGMTCSTSVIYRTKEKPYSRMKIVFLVWKRRVIAESMKMRVTQSDPVVWYWYMSFWMNRWVGRGSRSKYVYVRTNYTQLLTYIWATTASYTHDRFFNRKCERKFVSWLFIVSQIGRERHRCCPLRLHFRS